MSVTREALDWSSEDVEHFRAFLESKTGTRLVPKLAEHAPLLLGGGEANDIITRAGELRGFQSALHALLSLTEIPPTPQTTSDLFPSLDDDAAWKNDEKK